MEANIGISNNVEDELAVKYLKEWTCCSDSRTISRSIPCFYANDEPVGLENTLKSEFRKHAMAADLTYRHSQLINQDDLTKIGELLDANASPPIVNEQEKMINYTSFKKVGELCPANAKRFFGALTFGRLRMLRDDPLGRISVRHLLNYLSKKSWLEKARIRLSVYDTTGKGYMSYDDLTDYVTDFIPQIPSLAKMDEAFFSFYVCTATRRILFSLDPHRINKFRIVDLIMSGFLDDLADLHPKIDGPGSSRENDSCSSKTIDSDSLKLDFSERNWFSYSNAMRVYGIYVNLDVNSNGMLSKDELIQFGEGGLTEIFVERLFQECVTYKGEMDYRGFLDFIIAMEHKNDPASLTYFFRILDLSRRGYLDAFTVKYFFRPIKKKLDQSPSDDQPEINIEDVKDEIFDMVRPRDPSRITLKDLISCGQGETVVNILTDFNGFLTHENREYYASGQKDDDKEEDNEEEAVVL